MKPKREKKPGKTGGQFQLLIVEDHEFLLSAVEAFVAGAFPRCQILLARSGEEAVASAREECPHLVLMDVGLPGISGIEATSRIKSACPKTKVVVWSLSEDASVRRSALAAGADAFMLKDEGGDRLVLLVKKLIRKA